MSDPSRQAIIEHYLRVFQARDLPACAAVFSADGQIYFLAEIYAGQAAIEQWHRERFAAELEIVRVDQILAEGDLATADLVVTSQVLRDWEMPKMGTRLR